MSVNPYLARRLPQPDNVSYNYQQPVQSSLPAQQAQPPQTTQPTQTRSLPQPDTQQSPPARPPFYEAGKDLAVRFTSNPDIVEVNGVYYQVVSRRGDIYMLRSFNVNENKTIDVRIPDTYLKEQERLSSLLEQLKKSGNQGIVEELKVGRFTVWENGVPKTYHITPLGFAEHSGRGEFGTGEYQIVGGGKIYRAMGWDMSAGGKPVDLWFTEQDIFKIKKNIEDYLNNMNVLEIQTNPVFNTIPQRLFKEGDKWYTFSYNPRTDTYQKAEVPLEQIRSDLFAGEIGLPSVRIRGYSIPNFEKYAQKVPSVFMSGDVEDVVRQARLKETFPELASQKYVNLADVQNVLTQRLESYGWRPDTREKYDTLLSLSETVFQNPEAWTEIEKDINRQIEEARTKLEELQRFYEAKALKQWEAESEAKTNEYMNRLYGGTQHPASVFMEQTGSSFLQQMTFGLLGGPSQFQQKLYGALGILGSKAGIDESLFRAGIQGIRGLAPASFFGTDLLGLDLSSAVKATLGIGNIAAGKASLSTGEAAYIKAVNQDFTPQNLAAYMAGSALGAGIAMYIQGKAIESIPEAVRFTKWELTSNEALIGKTLKDAGIELKTPEFLSDLSKTIKTKALSLGEKAGLVERVQYVPTEIDAELARISSPGGETMVSKVEFTRWARAEEVLGKKVPEQMKLQPGEVSTLPVDIGGKTINVPIVGRGEFGIVGGEKISYTKEGLKLNEPFFVYGKGTGEESFLFAKMSKEAQGLSAPRYDFLKIAEAKISYQKVFEQAMGGTPKAVLYTEEMEKALGFSRTPKIPVLEKYTSPLGREVLPLKLPLYITPPKTNTPKIADTEPKIPFLEDYKPDISIKPVQPVYTPPAVSLPAAPKTWIGDVTAVAPRVSEVVAPKLGEITHQKIEPKTIDITITVPKLEPKINIPPQSVPDYPQPPQRTLPKMPTLPPIPPIGLGTRDVPMPGPRLYGRREWLVQWFGPGAPISLSPAKKTRKSRRGGRKK